MEVHRCDYEQPEKLRLTLMLCLLSDDRDKERERERKRRVADGEWVGRRCGV